MISHPGDSPTEALLDGRYRLGACVGEGGMARVYRAEDLILERTVAIKLLRPGADAAATPERARREVTVLAGLNHPSLVTLFDAHVTPGSDHYLVMEYVDGPSLAQRLADGPLPARELAGIVAEIADALRVVHASGVVHRDIKPSNVLLAPTGIPVRPVRAKLADFGVAYLVDSTRHTTPGLVVGTGAYLAPEQVRGEPLTPAADIYALGLMLLEAATGRRAFPHATGIGAVLARLTAAPEIPAWLGPEWTGLLVEMTALDPAARPDAAAVAVRAAALPALAPPPPDVEPAGVPVELTPTQPLLGPVVAVSSPFITAAPSTIAPPVPHTAHRGAHAARRRRRVRPWIIATTTAVVVAGMIPLGLWAMGSAGGALLPRPVGPVLTEPTPGVSPVEAPTLEEAVPVVDRGEESVTEPVVTTPVVAPVTGDAPAAGSSSGGDSGADERAQKKAEQEQKKAEQEQKKAEQEQKKAEQEQQRAQEKLEREQQRAAEAERKAAEKGAGNAGSSPAPPSAP